jgi:hypothetical protein
MARHIRVLAALEDKSRSQFVREVLERTLPAERMSREMQVAQHG